MNLLARHSADPTHRHWTGEKHILIYNGTKDLGLFFKKNHDPNMIRYTDAGYLSGPHPKLDLYSYMKVQLFHEVF